MQKHDWLRLSLLYSVFLLCYAVLRSHTFWGELVHDDGLFLLGAQSWAKGYVPYRDFWDHKPPCVFLYNAIPLYFFPFSLPAIKVFHCLVLTASAVMLYLICRKYVIAIASIIACLCYIYFTSQRYTIQSGGLTEEGALLFVIAAYWLLQQEDIKQWWKPLLAGLCLGMAVQFRQTYVVEAAFAVGLLWMNQSTLHKTVQYTLYLLMGMIIPEIVVSLYFLVQGIWWDYFEAGYLYNFYYIGPARPDTDWHTIVQRQIEMIQHSGFYLLSPLFSVVLAYWMKAQHRRSLIFLTVNFIGDCIAVSLSGEYYAHYYVQAAVTCGIFLALTVHTVITIWQQDSLMSFSLPKVLSFALIVVCIFLSCQTGKYCYRDTMQKWAETGQPNSEYTFQHDVAEVIEQITLPDDKILLIGRIPNSVYFLSNRLAGSRFYHYSPLWKPSLKGALTERQKQLYLNDLTKNKPVLLLLDLTRLGSDDGLSRVEKDMPEALPYIHEHYTRLDEKFPNADTLWDWYNIRLQIMVRKDRIEDVINRMLDQ